MVEQSNHLLHLLHIIFHITSMIAQVEAGLPVLSERMPAMIPPMMPPTSKMVDNIAASSASTYKMEIIIIFDIDTQPCPWREYSWEASREMCRRPAWQRRGWKIGETGVKSCCCFIFTWLKIRQLQGWRELLRSWLLPPLPLLSP